jgi:hypothetical protein
MGNCLESLIDDIYLINNHKHPTIISYTDVCNMNTVLSPGETKSVGVFSPFHVICSTCSYSSPICDLLSKRKETIFVSEITPRLKN